MQRDNFVNFRHMFDRVLSAAVLALTFRCHAVALCFFASVEDSFFHATFVHNF